MGDSNPDWSTDSTSAVHISLVKPDAGGSKSLHTFNPKFTYSIFGDEERIFGYQGLKINLRYNASDMRPGLQITYTKRFKAVGDVEPTDLKTVFEDYLPKTAFEKTAAFDAAISDPITANWTPPGELWQSLESKGKTYEVWRGSLADPAVQQILKRIQILVPLFIEGGTLIDLQDPDESLDRWTVFFLYEKSATPSPETSPYTFLGYSTVFRFFYYQSRQSSSPSPAKGTQISLPSSTDFDLSEAGKTLSPLPCRSRISQFIILPSFHGGGHGSRFYNSIFDYYYQEPQTVEITVEDPNEAFDDMRDLNDLARLRKVPEFAALRINPKPTPRAKGLAPQDIVDADVVAKIKKDTKIAPRQFARLVEMQLLSNIPTAIRQSLFVERPTKVPDHEARQKEYKLWKLLTKQRLYRHNKDSLMQLERAERIDKLDDALGNVEADYARLLRTFDERQNGKTNGSASDTPASNGKRASPMDEDDGEPSTKKIKFS